MDWSLSSFDLFTLNMVIKGAWIYRDAPQPEALQQALCQLGNLYPHLSGRYSEQRKAVVFSQSAPSQLALSVADLSSHSVTELLGHPRLAWSLVKEYDINRFKDGAISPFSTTLAQLKDGAILYVQCAHAVMDGHSFMQFMQQWADLYQGRPVSPMVVNQLFLPRPEALSKTATLQRIQELGWLKIGVGKLVKMLVNLRRNNSIKQTFIVEVPVDEIGQLKLQSHAGTNAVLSALAMKHLAAHLPKTSRFKLLLTANLRGRISGFDSSFCGNFSQALPLGVEFNVNDPTTQLAAAIEQQAQAALNSPNLDEQVQLSISSQHYSLPYFYFDASDMNCPRPGTIYINNQLRLKACLLDFGHGLPLYAFPNDLPDMVKFWQPVHDGPVQIIFAGQAAKIMSK